MAFVQTLSLLLRDKAIKRTSLPILCDEGRTFGMGMFRQLGIYSHQQNTNQDSSAWCFIRNQLMVKFCKKASLPSRVPCRFISWRQLRYANYNVPMRIPFYIYYSMFGHQRVRGFVLAGDIPSQGASYSSGTAGKTTFQWRGL
jgi:pyruvate dehydrogenase E1 component